MYWDTEIAKSKTVPPDESQMTEENVGPPILHRSTKQWIRKMPRPLMMQIDQIYSGD